DLLPTSNSISTNSPPSLIEFINWGLLILRNGLLNNPKHRASKTVDLPDPFSPTINVVEVLFNCISVN
ncbi:uncharacterized protein METZ01_LOCUS313349, partial [marine metagenome]